MWTCSKCKENIEDNFDACWKCGAHRDGSQPGEIFDEKADNDEEVDNTERPKKKIYWWERRGILFTIATLFFLSYTSISFDRDHQWAFRSVNDFMMISFLLLGFCAFINKKIFIQRTKKILNGIFVLIVVFNLSWFM